MSVHFAMVDILEFCRENGVEIEARNALDVIGYEIRMSKGNKHISRIIDLSRLDTTNYDSFIDNLLIQLRNELEKGEYERTV